MMLNEEQFSQNDHEREWYVAKVFRRFGLHKQLSERWKKMNYKPQRGQVKLEL